MVDGESEEDQDSGESGEDEEDGDESDLVSCFFRSCLSAFLVCTYYKQDSEKNQHYHTSRPVLIKPQAKLICFADFSS